MRPGDSWLFEGRTAAGHISSHSVSTAFQAAVKTAGITKRVTSHSLRHTFATHMLDSGSPLPVVQAALGHASITSTQIYLHTSVERISRATSPYDLLGTPSGEIFG